MTDRRLRRPDGDRIGPDANEPCMPETHLSGKTHEQIEPKGGEGKNEHQGSYAIVIRGRKPCRQREHDRGEGEHGKKSVREDAAHSHPLGRGSAEKSVRHGEQDEQKN